MAEDFRVEGAEAFYRLGKRMKSVGRGDLLKEMNKALQTSIKPLTPASRAEAMRRLPARGGLNKLVAKSPQRTTARVGGTTASARTTVAGKKSGAYGADKGKVRHKTFGRKPWQDQSVPPGWFSDTAEKMQPEIRDEVVKTLADYAERVARG